MAATIPLREALNHGISSGNFVDTKITLYSYKNSSGRICRPRSLHANSHVLKTVPYFNDRTYIATLNIVRTGSHGTASKYYLGISLRRDQETSAEKSTKRILQKITGIRPTATSRTRRTSQGPCNTPQPRMRPSLKSKIHPIRRRSQAGTRWLARTTRSGSNKGR